MIKNDKQYIITKVKRDEFSKSLESFKVSEDNKLLDQIMKDAITSQIMSFDRELHEYEQLKNEKTNVIISSVEKLPEILIKARIIKGMSQNELAKKVGLKEQQIQRYESNSYESANFERILSIANSMGIRFENTKAVISEDILEVKGYDPLFIKNATNKLQSRKSLLSI